MYSASAGDWSSQAGPRTVQPLTNKHNVQPGETLESIAAKHGHSPSTLLRMNSHLVGRGGSVSPDMRLNV